MDGALLMVVILVSAATAWCVIIPLANCIYRGILKVCYTPEIATEAEVTGPDAATLQVDIEHGEVRSGSQSPIHVIHAGDVSVLTPRTSESDTDVPTAKVLPFHGSAVGLDGAEERKDSSHQLPVAELTRLASILRNVG